MAYIKLNKNNFFNNLDIISKRTKSIDKIAVVLKDNAYGHGLLEIASLATEYGIKKAVVRTTKEALAIEEFFDYILVLADTPKSYNPKICYTINSLAMIEKFAPRTRVELKVDSGMHRNGIDANELRESFELIQKADLALEAVFTHHASADELTSEWFWQAEQFCGIKKEAQKLSDEFGFGALRFHSSNSAALFRSSEIDEDMVRVGIAIYGCLEMPSVFGVNGFLPVLSLWAEKNSQRTLASGTRVGYGGDGIVAHESIVSNYDFGYADGFFRSCAKNGFKTPDGTELVGRVSMDNSSFFSDKDELLIFDDARAVANYAKTISYEVLTSLKPELKRAVV